MLQRSAKGVRFMVCSRFLVLVCSALLAGACSTSASRTGTGDTTPATAELASTSATDATAEEEDPLVCRSVVRTGSRVAERTCVRRSQIEKKQKASQEALQDIQRRGTQTGNPTKG
jgi:hypothetical protein